MAAQAVRRRHIQRVAQAVPFWVAALGCSLDERKTIFPPVPGGPQTEVGTLQGAALEVRPPSVDLGAVTTGFASRARLVVANPGSAPLEAPRVEWAAESAADYQVIQNQCTQAVPPGKTCEVRVQLVPSRAGALQGTLQFVGVDGAAFGVPFAGEGFDAGTLILAPVAGSTEDFGPMRVGDTSESTFSVMNPGTSPSGALSLRVNRPEFTLLPPQPGECVPGATDLGAGQLCNVRIGFAPGERGPLEATLTAITTGAGSVSLNLAGAGLVAGVLVASASTLDFAGVVLGSSGIGNVRFDNQGDEPLTLAGARLEPADVSEFSIRDSGCGAGRTLEPGAACEVELEFRPLLPGEERSTELVVDVTGSEPLRVGLVGHGLDQGSLLITASEAGGEEYGDVLLDQTLTHVFQVSNPGAQPSGVLSLAASGSFALTAAPQAGDCVEATTSLATGESCTVRVDFQPKLRQAEVGALTISSALAGATRQELRGRGVLAATFEVPPEVNFGRVLTNANAERTINVKNVGDQPLAVPSVDLTSGSPDQAAAFSVASGCSAPLAFGEECVLTLTFTPVQAVPHSANLQLSADGASAASVLLLGEALTPGSLVVAPADGNDDFGDVPIGTTVTRSFSISNPGNVASGPLTITSDENHFVIGTGDCNQGPPEGLVDGSSCSVNVAFTPTDSEVAVANLSVQSSGAGRAGLEIRGRGRSAPALAATGNRDLGRANIGRPTTAANAFTWTVNNEGDLPTGALQVTRGTVNEFRIGDDTCSDAPIAGHSTCQMQISFVPAEPPGPRTESIVVTDPGSGRALTLVLTAESVRVADPGQSCINAECSSGVCTDGVCCDRDCASVCQQCSVAGVCNDLDSQEQCGNGAARCFGVDQCLLPAGQACGADSDCGGGLLCKTCQGGGRQCTPAADCCGGCPGNQDCTNGSCGCGANEFDCGGGLCIPTNQGSAVCCPSNPGCPTNLPACTNDGRCVACLDNDDCGGCSTCNVATNTCTPRPRGTGGFCPGQQLCNGAGGCFAAECGFAGAPACRQCTTCQDFACRPGNENAACQGNGQCTAGTCRPGEGSACQQGGTPCANNLPCVGGVCGVPLLADGAECQSNAQCDSGRCLDWFADEDGDDFGAEAPSFRSCGVPNVTQPPPGLLATSGDCCDTEVNAFPGQTRFFSVPRIGCMGFDYNCLNGDEFGSFTTGITACDQLSVPNCTATLWTDPSQDPGVGVRPPPCGVRGGATFCGTIDGFNCEAITGGELTSSCR